MTRAVATLAMLAAVVAMPGAASAQPGVIQTVAGSSSAGGYFGDGGPATAAGIASPYGAAVDAAGNFYIADGDANRVRRVDAVTKIITTVAGTGTAGFSGDGGLATDARLNFPIAVALDSAGNLYITDYSNYRIRKVDAVTGIISTFAGNGVAAYAGDGGPATAAGLKGPWGIAFNAGGDLYIADYGSNTVRMVAAATGLIATVAGTAGYVGFSGDGGPATDAVFGGVVDVALDAAGNFYVADNGNHRVRMVTLATGIISTVAGNGSASFAGDGGPATAASVNYPYGVGIDGAGNLVIADTYNDRVRMVAAATGIISTIAGTGVAGFSGDGGPATAAQLSTPADVAFDSAGRLFISDYDNYRVRMVATREVPVITWGSPAGITYGTALSAAQLNATASVAGAFVYTPPAGTVLNAGAGQTLSVLFTPDDLVNYTPVSATVSIDVAKAVPIITWAPPAPVPPGTLLSAAQLNATASVPGAFVYTPPAGTKVTATIMLHADFTPANSADYAAAGADVQLVTEGLPIGPPYTLTVTPAPGGRIDAAGIACGAGSTTCSVTMPASMTLGLKAVPSAGYAFANWTGDCSGTSPDLWLALAGARACSAVFTPLAVNYQLTIAPKPSGGTVAGSGLNCGTGGTTCVVGFGGTTSASLTATPDAGNVFTSWGGACSGTDATTTVLVNGEKTCTAGFAPSGGAGPPYTLTVVPPAGGTVRAAGINCGAGGTSCSVTMPAPMTLGLQATPSTGYAFTAWSGDCGGTSPAFSLALQGPRTCGAVFTPLGAGYQLTIAPKPSGGTVAGSGLSCGTGGNACAVSFGGSTTASLTATPDAGYVFMSWGGSCSGVAASTSVLVDGVKSCSATFAPNGGSGPPYTLTITPPTGGKIQGAGINCGAGGTACSVTMPAPLTLGLQATPSAGWTFGGWTGDCTGPSPSLWLNLDGARACGAVFNQIIP